MEELIISLEQLDLTKIQIRVYLALLQLKQATIQEIAAKSKVKRTSVYHSLNNLIIKGLATFTNKGWHRQYFAENPKKVLLTFKDKQDDLKQQEKKFMNILPDLASLYSTKITQPKVAYYDGIDGIKQLYEDTLITLSQGDEILAYVADYDNKKLEEYMHDYVVRRAIKGIRARGIAENKPGIKAFTRENAKELRTTKLVSEKKFNLENEINIYADKMIIITYTPEPFGVLIESKAVANTQRAIFEMAWNGLK